jgi:starch phosphorylase
MSADITDHSATIAYFSMEIAVDQAFPTYSGGLGVLAGDSLRAGADLGIPMVGVTLLHRKGYFRQHLDAKGNQSEEPACWNPEIVLEATPVRASVLVEGQTVWIRAWKYKLVGVEGSEVPVYFLDTDLPENSAEHRELTSFLYGGDQRYRLCQEVVLGVGGVAILKKLGYDIATYHMNEGHSALLTLGLLATLNGGQNIKVVTSEEWKDVRKRCIFTTHTPVPAGQDQFSHQLACHVLGDQTANALRAAGCYWDGSLNMTHLALQFTHYVNGVASRHREISRGMFPGYPINSITNGVHAGTWTAKPFRDLFDERVPEWRIDNPYLRYAVCIPIPRILLAHSHCKQALVESVAQRSGAKLDPMVFTIGFARRATAYKRQDLIFTDVNRLAQIARRAGALQIVFAGKAHPRDEGGKELIRHIFKAAEALRATVTVVYLEEYDLELAGLLCSGVDLWLNTPQKPQEASGTSGMKAALNGVPSLSVLDGWWVEGCFEGVTGWAIGDDNSTSDSAREAESLYGKLEYTIAPLFYQRPLAYGEIMRSAIALNGSFYNAQRMMAQYLRNAYQVDSVRSNSNHNSSR